MTRCDWLPRLPHEQPLDDYAEQNEVEFRKHQRNCRTDDPRCPHRNKLM